LIIRTLVLLLLLLQVFVSAAGSAHNAGTVPDYPHTGTAAAAGFCPLLAALITLVLFLVIRTLLLLLLLQVPVPAAGSAHYSGAVPNCPHAGAAPRQFHQDCILGAACADADHLLHQPGAQLATCYYDFITSVTFDIKSGIVLVPRGPLSAC
jgi:hypothetical protein